MKHFKLLLVAGLVYTLVACTSGNVITNETTLKEAKAVESVTNNTEVKTNYPRVDGSTANIPMMAQIRSSYLGEDITEAQNNSLNVTTTDYAWRNLIEGNNDLLLVILKIKEEITNLIDWL